MTTTINRDWLTTLWPGSYKGIPFHFEREKSKGGRGVIVHVFPNRDDPFVEDLGENPRYYEGEIYVHGDDVDATAALLEETLATKGPGVLVVPMRGPVNVHCPEFERADEKDKLGFVAFHVRFVRDGAATALISVPLAGRLVLAAGDRLAGALASLFSSAIKVNGQAAFVVAAAVDGVQQVAAAVDVVRQTSPVDVYVSARVRDVVAATIAAAPQMLSGVKVSPDTVSAFAASVSSLVPEPSTDAATLVGQTVIATVRALAAGLPPISAQAAMADFADAFTAAVSAPAATPSAIAARGNSMSVDQLARMAALIAWAEALALRDYAARPEGVAARTEAADRFEAELESATGADGAGLFVAIEELRGKVIEYLSRLINDLAPVIDIEASAVMPSLFWAWRLYCDPSRAGELVSRNRVRHPSFFPLKFTALSPKK